MAKKLEKYKKGGKLNGKPHSKGGIPIKVEGGEYIIKKKSVNTSSSKRIIRIRYPCTRC